MCVPEQNIAIADENSSVLALFGERFAQQFLSEAYSWLDCLIFACAPLGIITAIVGAIRVAGYPWMRSIIGRARENRASAEIEFMSSTSHEVCELWNGTSIVRTMGRPLVAQIIAVESQKDNPETFGLYILDDVGEVMKMTAYNSAWKEKIHAAAERISIWKHILTPSHCLFKRSDKQQQDLEKRPIVSQGKKGEGPIQTKKADQATRDPSRPSVAGEALSDKMKFEKTYSTEAPNILLNLHGGTSLRILIPATVVGVVLQTGVLVFAALASQWPLLVAELPSSESATDYGFHLLLVGTIFLAVGLFIVTFVIEQSTEETKWMVNDRAAPNIRVIWLQRQSVVGDQSFESYMLTQTKKCTEVLTSRRAKANTINGNGSNVIPSKSLFTVLGTGMGLIGFVCQFQGFRSVHWLCAIVQLGATAIMTLVRALIRGGFVVDPIVESVYKDHEIDTLALKLAKDEGWLWNNGVSNTATTTSGNVPTHGATATVSITLPASTTHESPASSSSGHLNAQENAEPIFQIEPKHLAHLSYVDDEILEDYRNAEDKYGQRAVDMGYRLRELTRWKTPISEASVAAAAAIKIMMDEFLTAEKY
ncbi:hypothetical protein ONS95_005214 [Cadophora gregata]|uniref:uncharacterized protein n=1 Tax=Cadophora gregata TaxID=51156 RepID=UPI0026DBF855|nr:uncharacterized protein ONS95_005214 [Cadophora gregata]KAK0104953.1 hypothetical protein ONS95_005214 [Cadophora gregata]